MALPADFSKIFGSTATGGLTPIGDVDYAKGWEFVGANPPTKNDFSYLQNLSDLKSQWLYSNKLQRTDPFGDIKSDGSVAVSTALANLGLKTAATRDVGTGANQIPDMESFASGDGWFKLPSGHIVQYGSVAVTNPNAGAFTDSANFKIPFVSEIYGVLVIPQTTASLLGLNPIFVVTDKTLTNFTIRADLNDVTSGSKFSIAQSYFYLALGK